MNVKATKFGPWTVLLTIFVLLVSGTAAAQGSPLDADGDAEAQEEESRLPQLDDDDPMYWAEMREVYAMQQRAFHKEGRFSATFYGGVIPNSIFEQYFPLGLRGNYYLLENIGLEASTSFNFSRDTAVNDVVADGDGIGADNRPLIGDTQLSHTTLGVKWSPVYGKFSFYEDRLFYFDVFAFGGAGVVVSQTQSDFGADPGTTVKPEGVFGLGVGVYAGQHAGFRADYRQFVFQKVSGGVANPSEISLGFSWFF